MVSRVVNKLEDKLLLSVPPVTVNVRRSSLSLLNLPDGLAFQGVAGSARRRLSNVSDVVSKKISDTIGWRSLSTNVELTVMQGSVLCGQYIKNRLKRSGIFQKKLGLKRMRSGAIMSSEGLLVVSEVSPVLTSLGAELEKLHPKLYTNIARQIGAGSFSNEQTAMEAIADVSRELLRVGGEMTWGKIISLYSVAGGIAVDCVRQGKPEFIGAIQRAMTIVLEEDLASWIQANGGWIGLSNKCRTSIDSDTWQERDTLIVLVSTTLIMGLALLIRIFIFS
ncbi:GSCOCG00009171001-RA-CDS [Cotesia congregata]|uniref:Similar to boka: Bcl-2-related ovarian killer protein homolog A (Danio rerio) n=1 Tax=Cotesia congregata TaxID=51543 RepID=A0A8J2H6G8_COTCN|nr:GSCOCG00009171001-RA-CDS [Cotesia congregata]CAG5078650.1 Similar to boka: Bcl-2-related ovarian killer protein homolog A (Danio rerio) [Cotesia congregata]